MAKTRLDKTLADYVVIALCPALIMTLVGSLVFFLMELSYRGQFESRMHWIMFWFVFAAVLVARIAIEEGREHARTFGIAMGIAAGIAVLRFVDAVIVGWMLLAVVWWCSSKLTWDCTLIDESEDTSGEGLLQVAGFDKGSTNETENPEPLNQPSKTKASRTRKPDRNASKNLLAKESSDQEKQKTKKYQDPNDDSEDIQTRPHAPGLWVVYFSLAALPLFGVGQLLIPAQDAVRRSYAFQLLAVYVASAIALLLMTSFLGLRRYLRQRKLVMPGSMTRRWLGMGIVLLVALMLVALLIPRPQGEYTLTSMIDKIDARARQASKFAVLKGDRAEGEGRRIGEQDAKSKKAGEGQPPDKQHGENATNKQPGGNQSGNSKQGKPGGQNSNNSGQSDSKSSQSQQGKAQDRSSSKSDSSEKNNSSEKNAGQADQQRNAEAKQREKVPRQGDGKKTDVQNKNADQAQQPRNPVNPSAATGSILSVVTTWLASLTKWIIYGLLAIAGVVLIIRYWSQLVDLLAKLWVEFLSLFGRKPNPSNSLATDDEGDDSLPKRPFASFVNPFATGAADRMTSPQLISYTFDALEAWSREQDIERHPEQTPLEFADELGRRVPALANDAAQMAQLYVQIAYARNVPAKERLEVLSRLWRRLNV